MQDRREIQAAGKPVRGTFRVPASKSFLNRALACAALAWGHSLILDVHEIGEDVRAMIGALNRLGVLVEGPDSGGTIHVPGHGGILRSPDGPIEVGEAGTAARFLTAMALRAKGPVRLEAGGRMRVRPMEDLLAALETLGAAVMRPADGSFPLVVDGRGVRGGTARLPGDVSSQFASALLLVAPAFPDGLRLELEGPLVSASYLDLTLELLQVFGARIWGGNAARAWDVEPGGLEGIEVGAPGDASSALFPLAAAAVTGGRVRVKGISPAWTQADLEALDILSASGCRAWHRYLSIICCGSPTRGLRADLGRCPDAAPALAMVAAVAPESSRLEGLGTLPRKESDRLACLVDNLRRLGGVARAGDDWLEIDPAPLHGGEIDPRGDHRIAMAFAVLGLRVPGIVVRDPHCVRKSWPSFWSVVEEMEPGPG